MTALEKWQYTWFCLGLSLMGMKVVHTLKPDGTPDWEIRNV